MWVWLKLRGERSHQVEKNRLKPRLQIALAIPLSFRSVSEKVYQLPMTDVTND